MLICNLQSFKNLLVHIGLCTVQPITCNIGIVGALLGVLQRFSLGCGCIIIMNLIQSYYIISCICLNNIRSNLSILQTTEYFQNLIRICGRTVILILAILITLFGCKIALYCRITVIHALSNFTHISSRIFFHLVQNLLSLFLFFLFLLISHIITTGRNADICERRLVCFIIGNCNISLRNNRIINLLLNCEKL